MIFDGTSAECAEVIAQIDAHLGYPRGYTEADIGVLVHRVGRGPWAPIESIRTETCAEPQPVDVDEDGVPTSARRRVRFRLSEEAPRRIVAKARVLRLLNRGSRAALIAVPGIGPARADAIIAARPVGDRWRDIEDLRDAGMPLAVMQAVRDYVLARVGDDDADDADEGDDAAAVQKVAR